MSIEPATILVVDDNEFNRDLLARQVQQQGYQAVMAEGGRQALAMMRRQPFDLVLLDIMMPEMNGYQVLEQMQADVELRHLPVIVISALNEMDSIVRCIELGAEDHLPRPSPRLLLNARIDAALEKKRWRDQEQIYLQTIKATSAAKSRFVTSVAHELKNTVSPIQGYLQLLSQEAFGPINEAQANILDIMSRNAERTSALVSDLSEISRIEAGHLELTLRPVSVAKIVADVVSAMRTQIEAKGQTVSTSVPSDLPPVRADDARLAQVLTNLLSNAHKYTPEGGAIRIWAEQVVHPLHGEGAGPVIHVAVEDTGIGIAAEEQGQIFEAFFRSADEAVLKTPGIGLGLNITKNLVELLGGRIWFESEHGRGTTFHFTVPVGGVTQD